ncbi:Uncharacterized protein dnl_21650 [Desulfonema limicola]|uniref:Uncharacterized protein n=1 Tax=Desulfonema limicola TaxID=45656 RepID=A0A975B6U9_9BACT|nr:Uncharacterized protein dnl_21650 [Desulfonema limicola]
MMILFVCTYSGLQIYFIMNNISKRLAYQVKIKQQPLF